MGDRVTINVSGRRYETLVATLSRLPQSLLGDEQSRAPYWDATRGEFFFDRSASSFEGVLLAYQTGGEARRPANVSEETFSEDLRFFGLSGQAERPEAGNATALCPSLSPPAPVSSQRRLDVLVRSPAVSAVSAIVTVLSVLMYILQTLPTFHPEASFSAAMAFVWVELACVVLLFVEAVVRLAAGRRKVTSFGDALNIIDVVSSVLFFISFIMTFFLLSYRLHEMYLVIVILARLTRLMRVLR